MSHTELNHWHTSEINFGDEATALACIAALRAKVEDEEIIVHGDGATVLLEGHFDFSKFEEDEFAQTIGDYLSSPTKYSIKNIFNDADGYFGGWAMVLNEGCEVLKEVSLNQTFEDFA